MFLSFVLSLFLSLHLVSVLIKYMAIYCDIGVTISLMELKIG